ncbi:MAG: hypothetical protein AAF682_10685 [Planctomycetota bacterium]
MAALLVGAYPLLHVLSPGSAIAAADPRSALELLALGLLVGAMLGLAWLSRMGPFRELLPPSNRLALEGLALAGAALIGAAAVGLGVAAADLGTLRLLPPALPLLLGLAAAHLAALGVLTLQLHLPRAARWVVFLGATWVAPAVLVPSFGPFAWVRPAVDALSPMQYAASESLTPLGILPHLLLVSAVVLTCTSTAFFAMRTR